jgi:uncharacterized membrane protein YoaK (UPF0700 family)
LIKQVHERRRDQLLLVLACAAGAMDALSLLGLGGVFTSALSGNTILLGIAIIHGRLEEAILCSSVFLGFIPGAIFAAHLLRTIPKGTPWTSRITAALAIESLMLLAVVVGLILIGGNTKAILPLPLIILAAFAMGLQYMTIFRLNVKGVSTTFITSTVVNLACRLALPERPQKDSSQPVETREAVCLSERTNLFLGLVWLAYFTGAMASAALESASRIAAALLPFALVSVVVFLSMASRAGDDGPLSTQSVEEGEGGEARDRAAIDD